jgi:hypothetical protein
MKAERSRQNAAMMSLGLLQAGNERAASPID